MDFWNSLKESSQAALEVVRSDLTEFTNTVQNETTTFFEEKGTDGETDNIQKSADNNSSMATNNSDNTSNNNNDKNFLSMNAISSSLGTLSDTLYKTAQTVVETLDDVMAIENDLGQAGAITALPHLTVADRIRAIQFDRSTYSRPPNQKFQGKYIHFSKTFNLKSEKQRNETQKLLQNNEILSIYHDLVPAEVEEEEFWMRYFFWKQEIEETANEESNQDSIMKNHMKEDSVKAVEEGNSNDNTNAENEESSHASSLKLTSNDRDGALDWGDTENGDDSDEKGDDKKCKDNEGVQNVNDGSNNVQNKTGVIEAKDKEVRQNNTSNINHGDNYKGSSNDSNLSNIQTNNEMLVQQTKSTSSNDSWTMVAEKDNSDDKISSTKIQDDVAPVIVNNNEEDVKANDGNNEEEDDAWDEWE
jgi:hypothetical protein